jgi:hypothetical protein
MPVINLEEAQIIFQVTEIAIIKEFPLFIGSTLF